MLHNAEELGEYIQIFSKLNPEKYIKFHAKQQFFNHEMFVV